VSVPSNNNTPTANLTSRLVNSFGSIVVDDPAKLTATIFEAVERTGVRALVSAGWSDIGGENVPENVFILGRPRSFDVNSDERG
jgi:UDP:flavonoid glycosyltransferase YjiC (YdhE family)